MKKSYLIAGGVALIAFVWILTGQFADRPKNHSGEPETAARPQTLPRVRVRDMTATMKENVVILLGRTEAERRVDVRVQTASRVKELNVAQGDAVDDDAVIITLDEENRPAQLAKAKAVEEQYHIAYEAARQLSQKSYRSKVTLAANKADWETAKSNLSEITKDIAYTKIKTPFQGIVDLIKIEKGDYVEKGDVVATVVDLDPIVISGEITEKDVPNVLPGGKAQVRFINGSTAEGVIDYVSKMGGADTRTFRVEVKVPNPEGRIYEGLTVELALPTGATLAHLLSPAVLTLSDQGVVGVKTVDDKQIVHFNPVQIIGDTPEGVWLAGLPEQMTLITVGQEYVRPGDQVVPVPEESLIKNPATIASGG